MSDTTATFVPTQSELDLLIVLDAGAPVPFPEDIKLDLSERLYENGFITVGVNGMLALSDRGRELLSHHQPAHAA
ncbi:MAG: hypothetical protein HYX47_18060 [Burkholderiales bacterium]|nr:hypothetical protein [Burkholderiales bacterium]